MSPLGGDIALIDPKSCSGRLQELKLQLPWGHRPTSSKPPPPQPCRVKLGGPLATLGPQLWWLRHWELLPGDKDVITGR